MEPFRYRPLRAADEIRLLRLPPKTSSSPHSILQATIHHAYLSDSPLYTAVSWMWGPKQEFVDLIINSAVLPVQANLERIIRCLQDDTQTRNLWVDAICIHQDSVEERNHQVGRCVLQF